MKNVKDQVYAALLRVSENASDVYPSSWAVLPAIQFTEEENKVYERTGNKEDKAYVRFRVDIWNGGSTSGGCRNICPRSGAHELFRRTGSVRASAQADAV